MAAGDPIYLDYNATTPLLPEVVDAMLPYLRTHYGNPSSTHVYGARALAAVDIARAQVAALVGAAPDEVLFTSGGTEANNLALRGLIELTQPARVVTSVIEHPAVAAPCAWLEQHGAQVRRLPVDAQGIVRLPDAQATIIGPTTLVSVMHSNNETGVLQPIGALAELAHAAGAWMHTDAAQSVGKVPIDMRSLGVDLLTIAGHKLYAPKGVGALIVRRGIPLRPLLLGAGHEHGLRPGTENVAAIVGLGVACAMALADLDAQRLRLTALRERLWRQLNDGVPGMAQNGHAELRLPNTLNVRFPGCSGVELLEATTAIAASTGSACHAGETSASAVLLAMSITPADALGSVRLSLGRPTTAAEVDAAAAALVASWQRLRRDCV